MKKQAFLCLFFAIQAPCFAADTLGTDSSFTIAGYRPVGYQTQSLEVSPSLNLYSRGTKDSNTYNGMEESVSQHGSFGASAGHYFRDQAVLTDLELSTRVSVYLSRGTTSGETNSGELSERSGTYAPGFSYYLSNNTRYRKYLKNALFLECWISPSLNQTPAEHSDNVVVEILPWGIDSSRYSAYRTSTVSNSVSTHSSLGAGLGAGWVTDVSGAAIALYMADCIDKLKGRPQKYSTTQMRDLSLAIDRLRRRRIFDSRLANIESVDTLCRFLAAQKFVDTATVRLAMEINDIWNYGFSQKRFFGKELKCMPLVSVSYGHNRAKSSIESTDSIGPSNPSITLQDVAGWPSPVHDSMEAYVSDFMLSYGAQLSGRFSNPLGRYFELDGGADISGTMNTMQDTSYYGGTSGRLFKGTYPNVTGHASLTLYWFPSFRSTISFNARLTESVDFNFRSRTMIGIDDPSWVLTQRRLYFTDFSTTLQWYYYLSPRCSYSIWGSGQYASGTKRELLYGMDYSSVGLGNLNFSCGSNLSYALF
jgi:hypothetical protein